MFLITWTDEASEQLVEVWSRAARRDEVATAAAQIEAMLGSTPMDVGESREEGLRILILRPLGVYYEVHEQDRLVVISVVWSF